MGKNDFHPGIDQLISMNSLNQKLCGSFYTYQII